MLITYDKYGEFTLSNITQGDLGSLRYTLNEGTEKLESSARFHKSMNSEFHENEETIAKAARSVSDALEDAVQNWVRRQSYQAAEAGVS